MPEPINEITFVARLGTITALRAERRRTQNLPTLIESGEVEERQVDRSGRVRRCDIRLNTRGGAKLVSGEMKRPEVPEGRDPRNESLRLDAQRKAFARGLPYYFTCNMAEVVLYKVAARPGESDREETFRILAPIKTSGEVEAYRSEIEENWIAFLDDLEERLIAIGRARPSATPEDVIHLRDAINAVAEEALSRAIRWLSEDSNHIEEIREEAISVLGFNPVLEPTFPAEFRDEVLQALRLGIFVIAQKMILYRVLAESGPRRVRPFRLDALQIMPETTDPRSVRSHLDAAIQHGIERSEDYETAFLPRPLIALVFCQPAGQQETEECQVGRVWARLLTAIEAASWSSISQNLIGFLYEVIVDPKFRHELGQFYTREDVVDLLLAFAIREPGDVVLDPAAGGGSFLRGAYWRKRDLGATHDDAIREIWGCEITAFAAELSTITLATADPTQAAAYPRILFRDFFDLRPGSLTDLVFPDVGEKLAIPTAFDCVVGNPPYISYRRQTNQPTVINALARISEEILLPRFSGKSDAYVWFITHGTQFLAPSGRLAFVVSSAILFSDYGVALIRFIGMHYRISAVIDSMVERWFADADTNVVLLFLEREQDEEARKENLIRFVRLRKPLSQLLVAPTDPARRQTVEDLIALILESAEGSEDPRLTINLVSQGFHGGLHFGDSQDQDEDTDE